MCNNFIPLFIYTFGRVSNYSFHLGNHLNAGAVNKSNKVLSGRDQYKTGNKVKISEVLFYLTPHRIFIGIIELVWFISSSHHTPDSIWLKFGKFFIPWAVNEFMPSILKAYWLICIVGHANWLYRLNTLFPQIGKLLRWQGLE